MPVGLRSAGADAGCGGRRACRACARSARAELVAVVGEHAVEVPAGVAQLAGDAAQPSGRSARRSGPAPWQRTSSAQAKRAVGVDRGELPDGAVGAVQTADVEAVDPDQLAGLVVSTCGSGCGFARRLVTGRGSRRSTPAAWRGVEAVAAQRLVDAVGLRRPGRPTRGRASIAATRRGPRPGWPSENATIRSSMTVRQLVGHHRPASLARAQHLQPRPVDLLLPAVIGRAVHPEHPTRVGHRRPRGEIEQLQAIAEQHVILSHATWAPFTWR